MSWGIIIDMRSSLRLVHAQSEPLDHNALLLKLKDIEETGQRNKPPVPEEEWVDVTDVEGEGEEGGEKEGEGEKGKGVVEAVVVEGEKME